MTTTHGGTQRVLKRNIVRDGVKKGTWSRRVFKRNMVREGVKKRDMVREGVEKEYCQGEF